MNNLRCPICSSKDIEIFLEKLNVPVHQNLIFKNREEAIKINRGNISLGLCNECGYIYNYSFDASKLSYGENYDNNQENSEYFKQYIKDEINYLVSELGFKNKVIFEI